MFMKSKRAEWILALKILMAFLVLCAYVVIYFLVFAPIVSRFFFSEESIAKGVLYWQEERYLAFDKGRDFRELIERYEVESKGEIVDFYYIDNRVQDNPFYGKVLDIYALDIVTEPSIFYEEKQRMAEKAETSAWMHDYFMYGFFDEAVADDSVVAVAFCDTTNSIRYMLITDIDELEGVDTAIIRNSTLAWLSE